MKTNEIQVSEYAQKCWLGRLESKIVEQVDFWNGDPQKDEWGVDQIHLFKLENKKYAVVVERGCSCYDYSDAEIILFDSLKDAKTRFASMVRP